MAIYNSTKLSFIDPIQYSRRPASLTRKVINLKLVWDPEWATTTHTESDDKNLAFINVPIRHKCK